MSTPNQNQPGINPSTGGDPDLIIDTSKMNAGQRAAMEITEGARELEANEGFASQMFLGRFAHHLIDDFPAQQAADKAIGDALCEKVGTFLSANMDAEEVDATRTIPTAVVDELFKMGVFAMKVPKEYGGLGLSQVNYNRVMMRIASYCGSTAVLVSAHQSIGVPQPLKLFGTEAQKKAWFPKFSQHSISAFALTEPGVGSDPSKMTTRATLSPDGKEWILNGDKLWCTNGPIADIIVVMAQTPPKIVNGKERAQITALVVEKSMPGIETIHRCDFMGIRGIQNGLIRFTNVHVPRENVLWGEGKGLKLALTTLNTGRLTLPAATTGMAKQCLSICRRWGNDRIQWGASIGTHECGRHKLAYIAGHTLAMEAVTWMTSHWADQHRDLRIEAAMAKLFTSETAWRIVDMTMQMRGGRGYEKASSLKARGEEPFPVERMMRDCRINMIIEGTSEIMRLFLSREAMDPHLRLAADVIRPGVPIGRKLKTGIKLACHYSLWYAHRWINGSLWRMHGDMGKLARHYRYVDAGSHRLARTIFHQMAKYQDKLERRQLILGRLMDIGTDLFAMATTCSYARKLAADNDKGGAIELADHFCKETIRRIEERYRELSLDTDKATNSVGKAVSVGDVKWLEEGVEWCGTRA